MYGFEAISYYKGWAMAIIGMTIVITCLVFLSVTISQLHKLLDFLERKKRSVSTDKNGLSERHAQTGRKLIIPNRFPQDVGEAAKLYEPLIEKLGFSFQLADLYKLARDNEYPHPHLTISAFRQAGILSAVEDGVFSWNHAA